MNRWFIAGATMALLLVAAWVLIEDGRPRDDTVTYDVSRSELPHTFHNDLFALAPKSLHVRKCISRHKPLGKDREILLGCRVDLAPEDLDGWIASLASQRGVLKLRPMFASAASLDLPEVDSAFVPVTIYSAAPLDKENFHGLLLLVNAAGNSALLYDRVILIID